jgi:diguanylate cyclase (GGDEF)-like protein
MSALKTLDASVISFVILMIVFIHSYSRLERIFIQYKLFSALIVLNMVLIFVDIFGRVFNGLPGTLNLSLNIVFNFILYCIVPAAPSLWVLYTYYLIPHDEQKIKRIRFILAVLVAANMLLTVISMFTGWFFFVDKDNIYHRGPLFFLHMAYCGLLILYSFVMICLKRKTFQRRQFFWILLFFVPQIIGSTLQTFIYGASYNWTGMMISMLIIYFNFQSREMNTDFLTGVNNRMHLQGYIKAKIKSSSEKKTFGAIMVDIDAFKRINDELGHAKGDQALIDAAGLLRDSLRRDDFIARYGGDEFIVIIDTQTAEALEDAVERIVKNVKNFNQTGDKTYKLSFSLGYEIYDVKSRLKADAFIDRIDQLMYKNKHPDPSRL